MTKKPKTEAQATQSLPRRSQAILDTMQLGVTQANADGEILYANPAVAEMHGYRVEELVGSNLSIFEAAVEQEPTIAGWSDGSTSWASERVHKRKDGSTLFVRALSDVVSGSAGGTIVTGYEDITERRQAEDALRKRHERESLHAALHDPLTGLPNKLLLLDLVEQALSRCKRHDDYMCAVMVLNLDRFHLVNDGLGHTVGDQLLIEVSERLKPCFRSVDTLARMSGDEFGILLDDISDVSDTIRVADRILEQLATPFQCGSEEVFTSGRIGVALSTTKYERAEDALRDATLALHRVKSGTAIRHEVFDPVMHQRAHARIELETDLRWAMEREEFRVLYQPIVSLKDGTIIGLEALLRWEHPRRGLLEPPEFLSVAEQTGMIIPLGSWVLEHSCRQMREWHDEISRESPLFLSVNLSGKQILWKDIAQHVESVLEETGFDGRWLRLEMKEMAMRDDADPMLSVLADLKKLKVSLDIDDFGLGYSSLRSLHRFPIDSLKIDRSFIENLHMRSESEEIVRTILVLAKNIGVSVVAEGVETPDELAALQKLDCEMGQGHLFSKPLPFDQIAELLEDHRYPV
jgi:diguanylate cyclase (GGDEF)-like protein/PAS domain S-box-containing protein